MTDLTFRRIEAALGVTVPPALRDLYAARLAALRNADRKSGGRLRRFLALTAAGLVALNRDERRPDGGTAGAYPEWWQSWLLVGDDGAGGFFAVPFDGRPGVWLLGSDDDGTPTKRFDTLAEFADAAVEWAAADEPAADVAPATFVGEWLHKVRDGGFVADDFYTLRPDGSGDHRRTGASDGEPFAFGPDPIRWLVDGGELVVIARNPFGFDDRTPFPLRGDRPAGLERQSS